MTPIEAAAEITTAIRAAGSWPDMREDQIKLEAAIRDTLRRFILADHVRALTAISTHFQLEERSALKKTSPFH